jgi:hypothetical protein
MSGDNNPYLPPKAAVADVVSPGREWFRARSE